MTHVYVAPEILSSVAANLENIGETLANCNAAGACLTTSVGLGTSKRP
jgi:PE family